MIQTGGFTHAISGAQWKCENTSSVSNLAGGVGSHRHFSSANCECNLKGNEDVA